MQPQILLEYGELSIAISVGLLSTALKGQVKRTFRSYFISNMAHNNNNRPVFHIGATFALKFIDTSPKLTVSELVFNKTRSSWPICAQTALAIYSLPLNNIGLIEWLS